MRCLPDGVWRDVQAERKHVVRGDVVALARFLQEEQLRHDRDRLEVDRERPDDLGQDKLIVEDEREDGAGDNNVLWPADVVDHIASRPEPPGNEVASGLRRLGIGTRKKKKNVRIERRRNEKDLHDGVVQRVEVPKQVDVAREEHGRKQGLGVERYAYQGIMSKKHHRLE